MAAKVRSPMLEMVAGLPAQPWKPTAARPKSAPGKRSPSQTMTLRQPQSATTQAPEPLSLDWMAAGERQTTIRQRLVAEKRSSRSSSAERMEAEQTRPAEKKVQQTQQPQPMQRTWPSQRKPSTGHVQRAERPQATPSPEAALPQKRSASPPSRAGWAAWTAGPAVRNAADGLGVPGLPYNSLGESHFESHAWAEPFLEQPAEEADPIADGGLVVKTRPKKDWTVMADFRELTIWQRGIEKAARERRSRQPKAKMVLRGYPRLHEPYRPEPPTREASPEDDVESLPENPESSQWCQGVLAALRQREAQYTVREVEESEVEAKEEANAALYQSEMPPLMPPTLSSRSGSKNTAVTEESLAAREEARKARHSILQNGKLDNLLTHLKRDVTVDGFSDEEVSRLYNAFSRFKVPGSSDVQRDDLVELLGFLGNVYLEEKDLSTIWKSVTKFEYLDFDDFQSFMMRYIDYTQAQNKIVFDTFDEDNSGTISESELRTLADNLGYMPLRIILEESLDVVDMDRNGTLDFDELTLFITVYRRYEGFCRDEVAMAKEIWERFGEGDPKMLPVGQLTGALVEFFGAQVADFAKRTTDQIQRGQILRSSQTPPDARFEAENFSFAEFLIFCRKCREDMYSKLLSYWPFKNLMGMGMAGKLGELLEGNPDPGRRPSFPSPEARSGGISDRELRGVLKRLNYIPLTKVMKEVYQEVVGEESPSRTLDYNEFFDFVMRYRQRCGFSNQELAKLKQLNIEMDEDKSGEINTFELCDTFRLLGYKVTMDDISGYLLEVDEDQSGQLSWMEFLTLMGLHRQEELAAIKTAFDQHADMGRLQASEIQAVFKELGNEMVDAYFPEEQKHLTKLTMEQFIECVDTCRLGCVLRDRRMAGYTLWKIAQLQETFESFDSDGSGSIDPPELLNLLSHPSIDRAPKTKQEQAKLIETIDLARQRAREAGVVPEEDETSGEIRFWVFVQLCRLLQDHQERKDEEKLQALTSQLQFSKNEVDQFRQIFLHWAKFSAHGPRKDLMKEESDSAAVKINQDITCRIFRSVGVSLVGKNYQELIAQVEPLMVDRKMDFHNFLRLMRWAISSNFAGLGSLSAK
eukprot:CAMPEP_0197621382 /NCGR_PEP_ID=MMETSP1338-20131121/1983_1 /TAXON_ID=43686 ORGANISM="Pelagodinium beii, Strain RCC1491" /NCGR_SAMPLE_ID=MMETSP1338 /ASSEMBLY_ACC=CAM_ASM_000754 /LENGTH=1093 /DNA_ID=CAMNT_0043190839 /DNA_START=310 /DNA_END=3592 /DNA_ORIENTATION=-